MASRKRSLSNDADSSALHKEWDEALCPICMDHPHNAVLLMCSSHDKGCRSYICDTSYRHSNCLDRFKKLRAESKNSPSPPRLLPRSQHISFNSERNSGFRTTSDSTEVHVHNIIRNDSVAELPGGPGENGIHAGSRRFGMEDEYLESGGSEVFERVDPAVGNDGNFSEARSSLRCPLCRGSVLGWEVVEEARKCLNSKIRSCSHESCSFTGSYRELRRHARRIHPSARPSDVDPSREQAWRHFQNQRAYGDIVSAIHTAMPGAIVLGDYVIENGDTASGEREWGSGESDGPWWTTLFLFHMLDSTDPVAERRSGRSRASSTRHRRSTGASPGRRFLWGRNLLGVHDDDDDDIVLDYGEDSLDILDNMNRDSSPTRRRRRQRLT